MKTRPDEMPALLERYAQDRAALDRSYDIPLSPLRMARIKQFVRDWRDKLVALDFDTMSYSDRVDYLLFRNLLRREADQIAQQEERIQEVAGLLPFAGIIVELEEKRRRMEWAAPQGAAAQMVDLKHQLDKAHQDVQADIDAEDSSHKEVVKKTHAGRAATMTHQLEQALERWFEFYNGYDPLFSWWVGAPYVEAKKALSKYATLLRERVLGIKAGAEQDGPVVGDPVGRAALLHELAYAMIPYTPEELITIGEREFAWCEAEMIKASRELGHADDWRRALEHVKSCHVVPGAQPALIKDLALEAITFLEERDLVTIPPLAREIWRMEMMSLERQKVNPFFLGGEVIRVSFPTHTMSHEQKLMSLRGNNVHFARATVHHELIPGHHLQGFMTARHRAYRRIFKTSFWGEGWALYWEMLLWDLGFPRSPEDRIGFLFWRMHRCARIIFSLRFHLGQMAPPECIEFLVQRVGHERANATAEVRRSFAGNYEPLYQCAYMIGGMQFRALQQELVESGQMTLREFHDAILRENSIPVEMLRAILTRQSLSVDYEPGWHFAG